MNAKDNFNISLSSSGIDVSELMSNPNLISSASSPPVESNLIGRIKTEFLPLPIY
jgi:hypothetical protein